MEILFITHKYPPSIGGMQKQSYELIVGMQKYAKVHAITYKGGNKIWFFLSMYWKVPRILRANPGINVIHFNDGVSALFCAWMRKYTEKVISMTYHGLDLVFPSGLYQKYSQAWIKNFDSVITVSEATRKEAINRGFISDRVSVVLNGVGDDETFDQDSYQKEYLDKMDTFSAEGRKILTSIGRPVKRKGFVWFVENILPLLPEEYIFVLIGPYPKYSKFLEKLLSALPSKLSRQIQLGLGLSTEHKLLKALEKKNERFLWLDKVNHPTKLSIIESSDLCVMPNQSVAGDMEGFGLVALEANILGKHVIATGIEGITSAIVDGENGTLLPEGDCNLWVEKIVEQTNKTDPEESQRLQEFVSTNYSWENMVKNYYNNFKKTLDKKSAKR